MYSYLYIFTRVRKYFYLLMVLSLLINQQVAGQVRSEIDSLRSALSQASSDTLKVFILSELAYSCYISDTKKALDYVAKGIALAGSINYPRGLAYCLNRKGIINYFLSNHVEAMNIFLKSLAISDSIHDNRLSGMNLTKIADIHRDAGEHKLAIKEHEQAIKLLREIKDSLQLNIALNRIALCYEDTKKYDKALEYFNEALSINNSIHNDRQLEVTLYYLGTLYLKMGNDQLAYQHLNRAKNINLLVNNRLLEVGILDYLSQIALRKSEVKIAISLADSALGIAQKMRNKYGAMNAHYRLYEAYKYKEDFTNSLKNYQLATELKDSIFNENNNKIIRNLQSSYEMEKKEVEIQKKQNEIQEQKTLIEIFIGSLIFVITITFILYYGSRQKAKAYALLSKQKQETIQQHQDLQKLTYKIKAQYEVLEKQKNSLLSLNEEFSSQHEELKMMNENLEETVQKRTKELEVTIDSLHQQNQNLEQFSYIISHNLRAPIARILGLINILDRKEIKGDLNHEILGYMEKATRNLDEIIHDLTQIISVQNSFDKFREKIYLSEIIFQNLHQFSQEIEKNKVEVIMDFSAYNLIVSVKSYVQSILHNIISNAIKYRSHKRKLQIKFSADKIDNFICLSIKDNGVGINLENLDMYKIFGLYQRMHDHVEGKGLGLYLVKTQIESLNGKIEMESTEDVGTTLNIYFPDQLLLPNH